nr:glycosyltransferase [uncultured Sphingorhabdus sp.]
MSVDKFHLITTTYQRDKELALLIETLTQQQTSASIQLHLLDQGDSPVVAACHEFPENFNLTLEGRYSRLGLSKARNILIQNIGVLGAQEIVAFPDDDCWYAPDTIELIRQFFEDNSDVDFLCTAVYDPVNKQPYGQRPAVLCKQMSMTDLFTLPISVGIFVKYAALSKAGAHFDESLGAGTVLGSGEETELVYRLMKTGAKGVYNGTIQVFHLVEPRHERNFEKAVFYGRGFGFLSSRLIIQGERSQIGYLVSILIKSLIGSLAYPFFPKSAASYVGRLRGIFQGVRLAMVAGRHLK